MFTSSALTIITNITTFTSVMLSSIQLMYSFSHMVTVKSLSILFTTPSWMRSLLMTISFPLNSPRQLSWSSKGFSPPGMSMSETIKLSQ